MMPYTQTFFLVFVLLCNFALPSNSICYYPNGDISDQDTPCLGGTVPSTCCGQGYACLSNNICMATGDEITKPNASLYVRGSCTDKTWRSSNCPLFCINPNSPNMDNVAGGEGIEKCDHTTKDMYYCIDYNYQAVNCTTEENVLIFQGTPSVITTIGVTQTSSVASSTMLATSTSFVSSSLVSTTALPSSTIFSTASELIMTTSSAAVTTNSPSTNLPNYQRTIALAASIPTAVVVCLIGLSVTLYFRRGKQSNLQQYLAPPYRELESECGSSFLLQGGLKNQGANTVGNFYYDPQTQNRYEAPGDEPQRYELSAG